MQNAVCLLSMWNVVGMINVGFYLQRNRLFGSFAVACGCFFSDQVFEENICL